MTGRPSWRLAAGTFAAGLVVVLATGCGAKDQNDTAGSAPARDAPAAGAAPEQAPGGADQQAPAARAPVKLEAADRSIIYTGGITVRVSDVDGAAATATTAAIGAGGFVGGDNRTRNDRRSEARLVLRVPSDRFSALIDEMARLGREQGREVSTQDVTEQLVDLEARIATAQASVDRVRALLARAGTISEIVSLESEVSRRESDLESLKGKQRKLADLTALSTITVTLLGADAPVVQTDDEPEGFLAGLKGGWKALTASLAVLLTVLGALLPWLVVLGLPVAALIWMLRRSAGRHRPGGPVLAGAGVAGPAGFGAPDPTGRPPAPGAPATPTPPPAPGAPATPNPPSLAGAPTAPGAAGGPARPDGDPARPDGDPAPPAGDPPPAAGPARASGPADPEPPQ